MQECRLGLQSRLHAETASLRRVRIAAAIREKPATFLFLNSGRCGQIWPGNISRESRHFQLRCGQGAVKDRSRQSIQNQAMKHFTCDLCGRHIADERYVARIEITAVDDSDHDQSPSSAEDHLEQIADEIAALEDTAQFKLPESGPRTYEFDLCPACQRRFVRDPLNRAARTQLNFSPN